MKNSYKNVRIKKSVRLTQNEIDIISAYAVSMKSDFSNSMRGLIINGLENLSLSSDLKNSVTFEIAKLRRANEEMQNQLKEKEKKNEKMLMLILKYLANINEFSQRIERVKQKNITEDGWREFYSTTTNEALKKLSEKLKKDDEYI